ncbi:MAG: hypothetical protein HY360_18040 [Verrucomicrobia bacterium]|nr:hypothetical protein [Verrucomicrobiota bacterium]
MNHPERIEELTLKLLDGALSAAEKAELENLIAAGPEAAQRHLELMEQEASLRGNRVNLNLTEKIMARVRATVRHRVEASVMETIARKRPYLPIEPAWTWLWGRLFWKLSGCAAAAALVFVSMSLWWHETRHAGTQEAFLYGRSEAAPGTRTAYRVFVRDALAAQPVPQAGVVFAVYNPSRQLVWQRTVSTDRHGAAGFDAELPDHLPEGQYTIRVETRSEKGQSSVEHGLTIKRSFKVLLTTDKPVYQPGQVIHIRSLTLAMADMRPIARRDAVIEVKDSKGNKVFKKKIQTSEYGIAAADFPLADQVNTGEYHVSAALGDTASERTVTVGRYVLPKYKIDLAADQPYYAPGEKVTGHLTAAYTFGKPVADARVQLVASEFIETFREFAKIEGRTDAQGRFTFEFPLKDWFAGVDLKKGDAMVSVEATITDTADHTQKKGLDLTVTARPIRIEVFPESGALVQNVENVLYIVTAYPDGRPAKTTLTVGKKGERVRTSDAGIAKVKITPQTAKLRLTVSAEDAQGLKTRATRELRVNERVDAFILRMDRAVYKTGETVHINIHAPAALSGAVFLDVVKDRQTRLTRSVEIQKGIGQTALDLPADLFGTMEIHAYRILPDGNIIGDAKVIQINRADDLKITASLEKETFRPAEKAVLQLAVNRKNGDPSVAALSLSGVDEAVFALQEMRPGLEKIYFLLQEEILKPRFEIHAQAPVTPQQTIERNAAPDKDIEEAEVVLFSAAEGTAAPFREASETFQARDARYRQEARQYESRLLGVAALLPGILFLALTLPVIGYAVWRLFHRQPIENLADADRIALERAGYGIASWWILFFYLALLGVPMVAKAFQSYGETSTVVVTFILIFALSASVGMRVWIIRFRENPLSLAVPILRKLLTSLGVGPMLAVGAIFSIVVSRGFQTENGLAAESVLCSLAVMVVIASIVTASILTAIQSVCWKVSFPMLAAGFLIRILFVGLPLLLFSFGLYADTIRAKMNGVVNALGGSAAGVAAKPVMGLRDAMVFSEHAAFQKMLDSVRNESLSLPEPQPAAPRTEPPPEPVAQPPPRIRKHFPETLLWVPELITDPSGKARLEIPLADSITTWRLAMSAVSARGELGSGTLPLRVFQDFFVDIDFPVALTQHDRVTVPVAIYNYLDKPQGIRLEVEEGKWFRLAGSPTQTVEVKAGEVTRASITLEVLQPGRQTLTVKARGSEMSDAVERSVLVEPDGQAVVQTINGELRENLTREVIIPQEAIDGASDLFVKIYPGAFSQVLEGLDNIFQMPSGCFEQTSSTTYPNILVLDYLRRTKQTKPAIEMKALNFINLGCQRLLSYEVKEGGFEWFGHAPAHNVLTAYGLMEFADMARVFEVDPAVIQRTRSWLLSQQQADGSFNPAEGGIGEGAINPFQGQTLRTTAYIAWALAEAKGASALEPQVQRALDYIAEKAKAETDAYALAVCANALASGGHPHAGSVLKQLVGLKKEEGKFAYWTSKSQGATYSCGEVLDIETTALAAYVCLKAGQDTVTAHKALAWLISKKDAQGTWHSTQATVHVLRALLAGLGGGGGGDVKDQLNVTITANGKVARDLVITKETSDVFQLISLRHLLKAGKNRVALETSGDGNMAWQIVATHYLPWGGKAAASQPDKELTIDLDYKTTNLKKDDVLDCQVTIGYHRSGLARMTIVDLGIPPGFDVLTDSLEALKDKGVIERFSVTGRQVIIYLRELESGKPLSFPYRLKAKFPVKAKTPRSQAYQYYEPEIRAVAPPVELIVL